MIVSGSKFNFFRSNVQIIGWVIKKGKNSFYITHAQTFTQNR